MIGMEHGMRAVLRVVLIGLLVALWHQPVFAQATPHPAHPNNNNYGPGEIVDAGHKAYSIDSGMPTLPDFPDAVLERAADEHGRIVLKRPTNRLRLGDKIKLIPGHCDPTVNLHDWYVGIRNDRVETLWPVAARGALT